MTARWTIAEIAAHLEVSETTVKKWRAERRVKDAKPAGRGVPKTSELDEYLRDPLPTCAGACGMKLVDEAQGQTRRGRRFYAEGRCRPCYEAMTTNGVYVPPRWTKPDEERAVLRLVDVYCPDEREHVLNILGIAA